MKRIIVFAVAAVAAAAPAAGGLLGNQSFASSVPVRAAAGPVAVARTATPVTGTPAGTVKAKHGADDPAGDNHGKAEHGADDPAGDDHGRRRGGHGADDSSATAASATIVPVSAKSKQHAENGDDHGRGRGSDDNGTDDKGKHGGHGGEGEHGGHDDGPNHT